MKNCLEMLAEITEKKDDYMELDDAAEDSCKDSTLIMPTVTTPVFLVSGWVGGRCVGVSESVAWWKGTKVFVDIETQASSYKSHCADEMSNAKEKKADLET